MNTSPIQNYQLYTNTRGAYLYAFANGHVYTVPNCNKNAPVNKVDEGSYHNVVCCQFAHKKPIHNQKIIDKITKYHMEYNKAEEPTFDNVGDGVCIFR